MARPTLLRHRKFMKLAQRLQSPALALGHLEFLWHAANETGDPVLGDADDVELVAQWRGSRGELVRALLECGTTGGAGFIEQRADGLFEIHDYWHHAPDYVRKRAKREQARRQNGDEIRNGADMDRTLTGQHSVSDQTPTAEKPILAALPHPHPLGKEEDSPLASARGAPVAEATPEERPEEQLALSCNSCADVIDLESRRKPKRSSQNFEPSAEHREIIDAFHEELPELPRVKVWNARRRKKLDARIRETLSRGKQGDRADWWRRFFRSVRGSDFLMGRVKDWRCPGLEWLLEEKNFTKVIEGSFSNRDAGARR